MFYCSIDDKWSCSARLICFFLFKAEDGIRDLVRSRGIGDVYKRQPKYLPFLLLALLLLLIEQVLKYSYFKSIF